MESNKEFSSTQINFSEKDSKQILSWAKEHIKESYLTEDGFEDEIHVTVLFGLHTSTVESVKEIVQQFKSFEITLGKVSKFADKEEHDVLKIDVSGDELKDLNKALRTLPHTSSYSLYKAHCTLAYVKKSSCDHLIDNTYFEGQKIKVSSILFSSKDRVKTAIPLE